MRALVTGGGGYLGRHIAKQLLKRGDEVIVLGRHRYREMEAAGAEGVVCDLAVDSSILTDSLAGVDVVFHAAALPPHWAPKRVFQAVNVDGTRRVVDACRAAGVTRLVYTSTPSTTFDGTDACHATEEDCPYPDQYETPYAETKAEAEQLVLAANGPELATTALRPHLIYGPEEPHMLPRIIERNRLGRLKIVGTGDNKVGLTFIDNAAAAHLQAADALAAGSANAGRAYFVTDPEPVALWSWINELLQGLKEPTIDKHISVPTARLIGRLLEIAWTLLPLSGDPPMTRFIASQLSTSHWYDLTAAQRDFGLRPVVDGREGLSRTIAWFERHMP
jgi:nucleoside-diphosphate-sugar epimerase